jgi:hypothetical protein
MRFYKTRPLISQPLCVSISLTLNAVDNNDYGEYEAPITRRSIVTIGQVLTALTSLRSLSVILPLWNCISDVSLESLGQSLSKLQSLTHLTLSHTYSLDSDNHLVVSDTGLIQLITHIS